MNDSNTKLEVWAAATLLGQYKMQGMIDATQGPFFVTIGKRCDSHVLRPRRPKEDTEPQIVAAEPVEVLTLSDGTGNGTPPVEVPVEIKPLPSTKTPRLFD